MKKILLIVVIIIVIILIVSCYYLYKNSNIYTSTSLEENKEEKEIAHEEKIDSALDTTKNPDEITIYDIEEGYLTVKDNPKADKNTYNFDKYLDNRGMFYSYKDDNYETKLGIDVSDHQGEIDWKKVKDSGVEFAIIRVGYRGYGQAGKIVLDSKFEENYKNAIDNGIEVGVYFFSQSINIEEAKEEAEFVLKNIEGKKITYPVTYDLEKIKNDTARTDNLTIDEINNMTIEFCKIIKNNGYTPSIYGNSKTFTTKMELELFNNYNKWYADYQKIPLYPYEFDMWQYTESGRVDGIEGNMDINICFVRKNNTK